MTLAIIMNISEMACFLQFFFSFSFQILVKWIHLSLLLHRYSSSALNGITTAPHSEEWLGVYFTMKSWLHLIVRSDLMFISPWNILLHLTVNCALMFISKWNILQHLTVNGALMFISSWNISLHITVNDVLMFISPWNHHYFPVLCSFHHAIQGYSINIFQLHFFLNT